MSLREQYTSGSGKVESYSKDKTKDHDEIVLRLKDGRRVVISNNTKVGKRVEPKEGDEVNYHGYGVKGTNVVHKVHPNKSSRGGWLEHVKKASSDYVLPAALIGGGSIIPWLLKKCGLKHNEKTMRYKHYYDDQLKKEKRLSSGEIKKILEDSGIKARFITRGKDIPIDQNQDFVPVVDDVVIPGAGPFFDPNIGPHGVVVTNGHTTKNSILHELGHAQDLRNGTYLHHPSGLSKIVDSVKQVVAPRSSALYKSEERAWNNAGFSSDSKASMEALKSYELGIRNEGLANAYRKVKLLGDLSKLVGTGLLLRAMTKEATPKDDILDMARRHYHDEGSHGWNHIEDVMASARRMRRRELLKKELAALAYHDSSLMTGPRETHAEDSAAIAGEELRKLFRKQQLKDIMNAIAHHRASYEGHRASRLEDLVAAADRNIPDVRKTILRSYKYGLENGMGPEGALANTLQHMPDKYGTKGYAYRNIPKIYMDTYGDELRKAQEEFDNVTPEQIKAIAAGLNKKE